MRVRRVRVHRQSAYNSAVRTFTVLVDGERRAKLRNGRTVDVEVSPGAHVVQVRMSFMSSPAFDITAGEHDVDLECRIVGGVLGAFTDPGGWLRLSAAESDSST